eukprot:6500649-Prymnesium_polylepis.1
MSRYSIAPPARRCTKVSATSKCSTGVTSRWRWSTCVRARARKGTLRQLSTPQRCCAVHSGRS